MVSISDVIREAASKTQEKWEDSASVAWEEVPDSERKILKKYAEMFMKKLKDEPFPEEDKKILRKHVKSFVSFIKGLKG